MEILLLLIVTLVVAPVVCRPVSSFFCNPIDRIFARVIGEKISIWWREFMTFAFSVVDVPPGVNIWQLQVEKMVFRKTSLQADS